MKRSKAIVYNPAGRGETFLPSFARGDDETRRFAAVAGANVPRGGLSLCVGPGVTEAAVAEAICYLENIKSNLV